MDAEDRNTHDQREESADAILADVLGMTDSIVNEQISDAAIEAKLRELQEHVAGDTGDVPPWVTELAVVDIDPAFDGPMLDQKFAAMLDAEAAAADRRSARQALDKVKETLHEAHEKAQAITDHALDRAEATKQAARIEAEKTLLQVERERITAAKTLLAAERAQADQQRERVELDARRSRLQAEAELAGIALEIERLRLEIAYAKIVKNQAQVEAGQILDEAIATACNVREDARREAVAVLNQAAAEADQLRTDARAQTDELRRRARAQADAVLNEAAQRARIYATHLDHYPLAEPLALDATAIRAPTTSPGRLVRCWPADALAADLADSFVHGTTDAAGRVWPTLSHLAVRLARLTGLDGRSQSTGSRLHIRSRAVAGVRNWWRNGPPIRSIAGHQEPERKSSDPGTVQLDQCMTVSTVACQPTFWHGSWRGPHRIWVPDSIDADEADVVAPTGRADIAVTRTAETIGRAAN